MSRRSPGSAAADWVAAIKAARASAVMSVFMVASIRVTDHRPSVRAAAHRPPGRRLRNQASHRRCRGAVMQVTLGDDSELYVSIQQFQRPGPIFTARSVACVATKRTPYDRSGSKAERLKTSTSGPLYP